MSANVHSRPFAWSNLALVIISTYGLGVAIYLTFVHYASVPLACSDTGIVNCTKVVTSAFSVIPHTNVPITVPGILFFAVSLVVAILNWRNPARLLWYRTQAALGIAGLLVVFYLVFVELVELKAICLWCSSVHLSILLILSISLWRLPSAAA